MLDKKKASIKLTYQGHRFILSVSAICVVHPSL